MRTVLEFWRQWVALIVLCLVLMPPADLPGSPPGGLGAAWADDDDDDEDGGGSNPGGGGPIGAGTPGVVSGPEPDRAPDRRLDTLEPAPLDPGWLALTADDRLVSLRTGAWNQVYRTHAVRGDMLALGVTPAQIAALEDAGFRLRQRINLAALGLIASRFTVPPGSDLPSALRQARSLAPGATLEANHVYRFDADPAAEGCANGDCSDHAAGSWREIAETCGSGIRIGMTDTAVDRRHPALRGRALRTETFDPFGTGSVADHGTAVAGLLIGNADTGFPGMLPGAELFAADVFHTNADGESYSTLLSLVSGLDWLVGNGVAVINISMTGPPNALLEETVRRLDARGVVMVAAAGNGGPTAPPAYPAAYGEVISVTAVDNDLRPYSMANRGAYISFSSPGVQIWSADATGSGRHRTGTSFAAAHASAIIAGVVRQRGGRPDIGKVVGDLRSTARDLGAPGKDPVFGWGLIQETPTCGI